ncbi:LOW QUALITY PROTEIN: hypothetical protein BCV70DRAFT_211387 [Testicularia cyperi]|uniref:Tr-type G domain-containing protein n=1 Tax=Testicularia cyperi TaxID=1882483 RepID=A0A317XQC6_9BASI|nr:LOW QUALITY PROTEIN: hypothetical protein BCV70DRAFT_211387 [Testicularia cyperi]
MNSIDPGSVPPLRAVLQQRSIASTSRASSDDVDTATATSSSHNLGSAGAAATTTNRSSTAKATRPSSSSHDTEKPRRRSHSSTKKLGRGEPESYPLFPGDKPWSQRSWAYQFIPFRGMWRKPYLLSDWTEGLHPRDCIIRMYFINLMPALAYILDMNYRTDGSYGVNEVILASALAAIVFSCFSVQPLTFVGVTGLINLVNYTQYNIFVGYYGFDRLDYLRIQAWSLIWAAGFHFIVAIFNICDYTRFITDMTSETFGFYVGIIYIQKGIELLIEEFEPEPLDNATGWLSVTIAILFTVSVYLVARIGNTSYLPFRIRNLKAGYAFAAGCIFWTGFSHFPKNSLERVPIARLPITKAFFPTLDRSWFIDFWNIELKYVFVGAPLGFLIMLLFYFDHNVSSVMAQARNYPPAGFHWDFFLLGITTLVSGFLGLPAPNGLAPVHTETLSVYQQIEMEDIAAEVGAKGRRAGAKKIRTVKQQQVVNARVVEGRISHLIIGLLTLGTMTRPLLVVLGTMPRAVFAGIFILVGWSSIEKNGITLRTLAIFRDRRLAPADDPLSTLRRSKIALYVGIQWLFAGLTIAISATIAGIGFPVIIVLLIPLRFYLVPRWFSPLELKVLDAPTADADGVLASLGHEPERVTGRGVEIALDTHIAGSLYYKQKLDDDTDDDDDEGDDNDGHEEESMSAAQYRAMYHASAGQLRRRDIETATSKDSKDEKTSHDVEKPLAFGTGAIVAGGLKGSQGKAEEPETQMRSATAQPVTRKSTSSSSSSSSSAGVGRKPVPLVSSSSAETGGPSTSGYDQLKNGNTPHDADKDKIDSSETSPLPAAEPGVKSEQEEEHQEQVTLSALPPVSAGSVVVASSATNQGATGDAASGSKFREITSDLTTPQDSQQQQQKTPRKKRYVSVENPTRGTNSAPSAETHPPKDLRNISIIAHIDAGKTTLTERLLHLTHAVSSSSAALPGDVDSGSTVTDFLEQERQRGITIQSAAVGPVWWPPPPSPPSSASAGKKPPSSPQKPARQPDKSNTPTHAAERIGITLVDTPGHIDFGIEVERALRVVDGAVVVLDGVEGVESQTENVWSQAARYDVRSLLLFINKLDRVGSSVAHCLRSVVRAGLHDRPLLLQIPVPPNDPDGGGEGISAIIDLVSMETVEFQGKAGEVVVRTELPPLPTVPGNNTDSDSSLLQEARKARHALVENLASVDDELLEELFSLPTSSADEEPHGSMPASSIRAALRRQTIKGTVLPVLCGSAAKNIGVQPLLDAIADYLPSPADRPEVVGSVAASSSASSSKSSLSSKDHRKDSPSSAEQPTLPTASSSSSPISISMSDTRTTALAFKVVHDRRRGPTTFIRVYSGTLSRSSVLFNTTTRSRERLSRVLFPFADQYTETETLRAGQIGVLLGLRDTRTGDTLVDVSASSSSSSTTPGKEGAAGIAKHADLKTLCLKRVHIPPPVFSMSLEPASKSDEEAVAEALNLLIRTDPSLHLDTGSSSSSTGGGGGGTGQTVLSGMGELHLEIAKDRLANEFGVNARMGSVRVSYRETLDVEQGTLVATELVDRDLAGKRIQLGARIQVRALTDAELENTGKDAASALMLGGNVVNVVLDSSSSITDEKDKIDVANDGASEADGNRDDIEAYLAESESQAASAARGKVRKSNKSASSPGSASSSSSSSASSPGRGGRSSEGTYAPGVDAEFLTSAFKTGLGAALSRGPLTSSPLTGLHVTVDEIELFSGEASTSTGGISYLVSALLRKVLRGEPPRDPVTGQKLGLPEPKTRLMEPMMTTKITLPDTHLGKVIADITAEQDGVVEDVVHVHVGSGADGGTGHSAVAQGIYIPPDPHSLGPSSSVSSTSSSSSAAGGSDPTATTRRKAEIHAIVPLANLVRYSSKLRALTAGNAQFNMHLKGFARVSDHRQQEILHLLGR